MGYLTDRIVHTMVFITPVLAGMRNSYITELKVTDPKTYHTMNGRKEGGKCLFNDKLNTFYLQLYGIKHMVKNHSDSDR